MNIETNQHKIVSSDRAIPGEDQRAHANTPTSFALSFAPQEPLNRRGRRNLAAELRRLDRRAARSLRRQEITSR